MRVGIRLAKTEWKSLPDLWSQSTMLCPQNTTCDCPDRASLATSKRCLHGMGSAGAGSLLPARLRRARTICILLPPSCTGHTPCHAFLLTSFLGSDCFLLCEKMWLCQEPPQEQLGNETSLCMHEWFILPFAQAVIEKQWK